MLKKVLTALALAAFGAGLYLGTNAVFDDRQDERWCRDFTASSLFEVAQAAPEYEKRCR